MSIKDKVKSVLGLDEEDFFEEEFELPTVETPPVHPLPRAHQPIEQPRQPLRTVEHPNRQQTRIQGTGKNTMQTMMSKVIIREPKEYSDASDIADCLKESLPVFVNLQRLDKGEGRRVIDFLVGCIYAVDGEIKRVGNDLFLCTPNSVETDGAVTETNDELSIGEL